MTLQTVRDYIASLGIASDDHCYMGKLDNKKEQSIGVYKLKRDGSPKIPIGGMENTTYGIYPVSLLVHWDQSPRNTETAAVKLFETLRDIRNVTAGDTTIKFCQLLVPDPVDVGTDDAGVYEMVIEALIYYERQVKKYG